MPKTWRAPDNDVPKCPDCQKDLSFVSSWTFRGLWGYTEVRTYECPTHGPIFVSQQISVGHGPDKGPGKGPDSGPDNGDRDSLVSAPRKPTPTLNADAIAIPEPDSD
jgi:hypothetical protein